MKTLIPRVVILLCIPLSIVAEQADPLSPAASLQHIEVNPGLTVELVASEPQVFDPVAIAFDEHFRMYVVENTGYPTGPQRGAVALLEDLDHDGYYETRHVFAEDLDFPNGIMSWRGGVLVTDAPHVYFFKDTTGDHRADVKEVLLEGFSLGGSTQLRVSHPTLSMDNWIYFTNGLSGGEVGVAGHPEIPRVQMGNRDLRYHPISHALEAVSGNAQFGHSFNDLKDRFVCSNRKHIEHAVLQLEDLTRNPYLNFTDTIASIPEHGGAARIYAISEARTTAYAHAGTFTAACGLLVYRGDGLPDEYYGNSFTCDPTGNLVHRDVLTPHGPSHIARRAEHGREFLASSDNWFRPVFLANAPDGALYLCDMYRQTIEHPTYLPDEVAAVTDFDAGKDKGRIYRIRRETVPRVLPEPVSSTDSETLAGVLGHPNAWYRETAHRLMLERLDPDAAPLLRTVLQAASPSSREHVQPGRLHALYLLEALEALDDTRLVSALGDPQAELREHAVRIARGRITPELAQTVAALTEDTSPRVRFAAALALGDTEGLPIADPLGKMLLRDLEDPWLRGAILGSVAGDLEAFSSRVLPGLREIPQDHAGLHELADTLGRMTAAALPAEATVSLLGQLWPESSGGAWQLPLLAGVLDGVQAGGKVSGDGAALARLGAAAPEALAAHFQQTLEHAKTLAMDEAASLTSRQYAVRILGHADFAQAGDTLSALLTPQHVPELQHAAVQALARMPDPRVAAALAQRDTWGGFTTGVRTAALSALLARPERIEHLVTALEDGAVPAWSVDPASRRRLESHADAAIQARAKEAFKNIVRIDRSAIYQEYRSVLELTPNPAQGREVFRNNCSSCHTHSSEGHQVGPDLTGLHSQPLESILLHILDPNWLMEPGYENYVVETRDFETYSGLIVNQTPDAITVRQSMGIEQTIPRDNIERISATSMSMMPEELEQAMTRQELRDLLGFLKGE